MALLHVSHPPWLRLVGVRTSYIYFSNISWTPRALDPITNPFLGPSTWLHPASIPPFRFTTLYNHIKDNGRRSCLLVTASGWKWTSSYLTLGQWCPERGVQHGGSPSCKGKDLTESKSVGCHWEVAGSVSKGWHYWTVGILVVFWR